jgi:transcriptional regulator with XRE-family HTH domain
MSSPKSFPSRLKQARALRNLSRIELAEKLNVRSNRIVAYENGMTKPSWHILRQLAQALEVTIDFLLGVNDQPLADDHLTKQLRTLKPENRAVAEALIVGLSKIQEKS